MTLKTEKEKHQASLTERIRFLKQKRKNLEAQMMTLDNAKYNALAKECGRVEVEIQDHANRLKLMEKL